MKQTTRLILSLVLLVVIAGGGFYLLRGRGGLPGSIVKDSGSNISDYSAVFLTNGQVYFGKIDRMDAQEVAIRDIYYLQVSPQQGSGTGGAQPTPSPDISLVKLGNELHGPNDRMRINRQQVLFTESLKADSKVVKAIEDFQK